MLANGDVFAGYVIERQLGRGGMGSVYLAKHPRLPRMTALKLLNREMFFDQEVRARFEREADLVSRLDHPNIVTVYDRGLDDEQLWISMQFIDGIDAASVDPETLPPARALQIVKETADALDYAHGMGVLHRDVKPANILLARSGAGRGERVYLTDFGIARLRDDTGHLTQTGTFTATLAYASPEQLTGASLDHRSDQYSLACTLFWLFTGSGPFAATNPAAVIQGHLQQPPPPLSTVRPGLSYALDGVLAKAMAKRPDDRFDSCSDFANAAIAALNNPSAPAMPIVGQRPTTGGAIPVTGGQRPTTGGAIPQTGSPYPLATQGPLTGGPMGTVNQGPHTQGPMTAGPMTAGPMTQGPMTAGPMANQSAAPLTGGAATQNPYQQQSRPQYPTPPAPPRPPTGNYGAYSAGQRPPSKSNTGLIVGIVVAVVVVLALLIGIGIAVSGDDSGGGSTTTTSAVAGKQVTPNADAISAEFSQMVPATVDGDTGYNGASCWETDSSYTPSANDGDPDFGAWVWQWRCYDGGGSDDPFYRIYVYDTAADVQAVINALPTNTKSVDTNGGKQYTNYKYTDNGNKIITQFTGDPDRAQFLMFTDGYGKADEVLRWWRSAPLN
ncbi:serine/threonine-protein kinase [Nocardia asteroides]|uniref:non-specific serine/threonine protein kinase n=1 Tax=Nocardia asteroides NBRC 15531 TaxID=1110697 RepID=U5EH78_NOCAS|nr:serine/threonine-protein kinase [Nocardia asteroides]TLF70141.1 serine/threonine protein kinase [Nocardia asteroides NBRC 15531]UGT49670.1 serine/threonine protein kinase [Nocardia asteroides]SFL97887.1 serine/threonine protein kinase [Nocardia asteroides]VEG37627.1 Serine/threonine-protein kinase pknF [Nocardia asteroides]BAO98826.1 putative serine/threonine protein kinase [Nocardia asteroides NBRC 15531]